MTNDDRNPWDHEKQSPPVLNAGIPWFRILGPSLVFLSLAGLLVWLRMGGDGGDKLEESAERTTELREVFAGPSVEDDSPEFNDIYQALSRLGVALHRGAVDEVVSMFDTQRMLEKVEESGLNKRVRPSQRTAFALELAEGLRTAFRDASHEFAFVRLEIKNLRFSPDRREALVYVRAWDDDDQSSRFRWWMRKSQGAWRVYDYEDLGAGTRASSHLALAINSFSDDSGLGSAAQQEFLLLLEAQQAAISGDIEGVRRRVFGRTGSELPPAFRANTHLLRMMVHLQDEDYERALAECELVETYRKDMPLLASYRGQALLQLGRYEEVLEVGNRFIEQLGDDGTIYHYMGLALEHLGRTEEALDTYRRGLDDEPHNHELLWTFALALPEDGMRELRERFLALRQPWELSPSLCEGFMEYGMSHAVETLALAHLEMRPEDREINYYLAWAKWMRDDNDEAAELVFPLLAEAGDDEQQERLRQLYLDAMIDAGKSVEAYETLGHDPEIFLYLGDALSARQQGDALERLIAEHQRHAPEDPALKYFPGLLHHARGEHVEAAELLSNWNEIDDPDRRETVKWRYLRSMYLAGRAMEAYDRTEDAGRSFALLAEWLDDDERAKELGELVERHRTTDPNNASLLYFEGRIAELNEDWDAAAAKYRKWLDAVGTVDSLGGDSARYLLVHALYKAGRMDEALESVPPAEETVGQLAGYLDKDDNASGLKELLQKGGDQLSETARTYFEARLQFLDEEYDACARQLRPLVQPFVGELQPYAVRKEVVRISGELT
jgi:tetratricopeptide (TPR) repeat protein